MELNEFRIGQFIEPFEMQCGIQDLTVNDVSGINAEKEFFEPSKQIGSDTSKYKVVPNSYFACNLMHVGRDCVLPIALNHSGQDKIVSPAYSVFKFNGSNCLDESFFFMLLKSKEMDRYFWFHTDSSIRDGMSWDDFCNTMITIPNIDVQKKYIKVYRAILKNQEIYSQGIDDLKLVIDATIDDLMKIAQYCRIGDVLEEVDERNSSDEYSEVMGINIMKQFISSNLTGKDLKKYKIVHTGEFAYSSMQTGRDNCIRIALLDSNKSIIVSPAYSVLKIKTNKILPEYIMMWFSRAESDRYGAFLSDGSVRANLDLVRFYDIQIPVPSMSKQQVLVNLYHAYQKRLEIGERLKEKLTNICPVLICGAMEEAGA